MCATRDPKGLYAKAQSGTLPNMTGIGQEYESPEHPEVHLDGSLPVDDNVEVLVRRIVGD
jgi:bifunctional enzyme CysN/CysC